MTVKKTAIQIIDSQGNQVGYIGGGSNGKDGVGVPAGGAAGDMLVKSSDTDFDTKWTPTNEQVLNAIKADRPKFYYSLGWWPSNKNLFDNADFRNRDLVINQRRQDNYSSAGYSIDRWILGGMVAGGNALRLEDNDIVLSATSAQMYFSQKVANSSSLFGENLTLSGITQNNTLVQHTFQMPNSSVTQNTKFAESALDSMLRVELWNMADSSFSPLLAQFNTPLTAEENIKYLKLELGTEQTLAHQEANDDWVLNDPSPQDYASELAKCQRYQINVVSSSNKFAGKVGSGYAIKENLCNILVSLPTTLRSKPSLIYTGKWFLNNGEYTFKTGIPVSSISIAFASNNSVLLNVRTSASLPVGTIYELAYEDDQNDNSFLLDSNL